MNTPDELEKIVDSLRKKCFKHGMEVGQELPEENPEHIFDPCNADDVIEAKTKLTALITAKQEDAMHDLANGYFERLEKHGREHADLMLSQYGKESNE